ncbi:uncharacterized protein HD556DRAFT_1308549 [Suillus plorans]|uniref:Uncharacterized protein n=1 Tax=Suillus plorans TaxID=116603 RepID=A0A9P7ARR4_9AGAM|nr:uncharacterized protein HD556DRAFT_1308549 [Suillus plorans]KAG1793722.1 hypothetical protein HD556DRAFT_1308549 [Suillus plorans]
MADDENFSSVADALQAGLENLGKWSRKTDETDVYSICLALDPNYKLEYARAQWDADAFDEGKKKLEAAFDYYHAPVTPQPSPSEPIPPASSQPPTQYGHSWMRSAILARQSSEKSIADPRHELALYLTSPLEEVADVVRWWGASERQTERELNVPNAFDYVRSSVQRNRRTERNGTPVQHSPIFLVYGIVFFNRELRTDETAYEWWSYLDKDRSGDAQPLASNQRLAVRIFSLVPNSMADERTGSTFTWLNSPLRSRQQAPPPKKKPTVKWRDMTSTIFSGKHKRGKGDNDDDNSENSDVDDDFADEAPNEPDMDNDDSELDVTDPDDIAEDGSKKVDSFDGESFDAASVINLDSRRLVDVLADKDLAPAAPRNTITLPPASTVVQDKVLTEADWDMT